MVQRLRDLSPALDSIPLFHPGEVVTHADYGWGVIVEVLPDLRACGVFLYDYNGGYSLGGRLPTNSGRWLYEGELVRYEPVRSKGTVAAFNPTFQAIGEGFVADGGQSVVGGEAEGGQEHIESAARPLPSRTPSVPGARRTKKRARPLHSG